MLAQLPASLMGSAVPCSASVRSQQELTVSSMWQPLAFSCRDHHCWHPSINTLPPKPNTLSRRPDCQVLGFSQALAAQLNGSSDTLVVWTVETGEAAHKICALEETAIK